MESAAFLLHGERVVEVLRRLRVDREREQVTEVDALGGNLRRLRVGLELGRPRARVDEQALEHDLDVARLAEDALELRTAAPRPDNGKIAGPGVAESLAVEDERHPRHEVRLADDQLAALRDLDDGCVRQTRRKRRSVSPAPAAPSSRPVPTRMSALSANESALTSLPAFSGPVCSSDGSAISL